MRNPAAQTPLTQSAAQPGTAPRLPVWISAAQAHTVEDMAFLSGAALAHLHLVAGAQDLPHALWRERLALQAAACCAGFCGRREGVAALRDALHLARAGDQPGPAGEIWRDWRQAVGRKVSVASLGRALPGFAADQIAACLEAGLDGGRASPVLRAATVLEKVLADKPRAETAALILADAVLSQSLGWDHIVPLLASGLTARDLRQTGDALRLACHRAVVASARAAVQVAADLALRAGRLQAVAPKLRAKGADQALALFLTRDALMPAELTAVMSDRAARRLCDRLVDLGVLRELTGRDTFRLYGV